MLPAQPLLVVYGVTSNENASLWVAMGLAILSAGVALPNVND